MSKFDLRDRVRFKDRNLWHLGAGPVRWIWNRNGTFWYQVSFPGGEFSDIDILGTLLEAVGDLEELPMVHS